MRPIRAKILVYLEGVEIPFSNITVEATGNNFSTCIIDFPPDKTFTKVLPRTYVEVYFQTFHEKTGVFEDDMLLFWDGEVSGRTWAKTPQGRSFRLECIDFSSYWSYVYGFFQQGVTQGFDRILAMAGGANTSDSASIFGIRAGTQTFDSKIFNILSDRSNKGLGKAAETFFQDALKLNVFLRDRNRRVKIMKDSDPLVTSSPGRLKVLDDPEGLSLFKANQLDEILTYAIKNVSAGVDLRTVINRFMEFFFYKSWPVFAPPIHKDATGGDVVMQTVLKPSAYFSVPLACNVLFPDQFSSLNHRQMFLSEPTRMRLHALPGSQAHQGLLQLIIKYYRYDTFAPSLLARILNETSEAVLAQFTQATEIAGDKGTETRSKGATPTSPDKPSVALQTPTIPPANVDDVLGADDPIASGLDLDLEVRKGEPSTIPYVVYLKSVDLPEESREDRKGIIPGETALTNYAWQSQIDKKGNLTGNYITRLASYFLGLKQHNRPTTMAGPWNPYVVAGFPGVVLNEEQPVFGEFGRVTHQVSADGVGSTTINMSYARTDDAVRFIHPDDVLNADGTQKAVKDFSDKSRKEPNRDLPLWINAAYRPEFAGEESFQSREVKVDKNGEATLGDLETARQGAYPALFGTGVKSLFQLTPDPEAETGQTTPASTKFSQLAMAEALLRHYKSKEPGAGREALVRSYQKRPVVTMAEMRKFLGAKKVNDFYWISNEKDPDKNPYRTEYQDITREVRRALVDAIPRGVAL